ncbi:hypothetical protein FXN63_09755 [Pigmentiphaga aceris]|uniref:Uncharacterized protein n=1 Tax=Pigmentiphaga aceris TaxID=1940612 RepID=A0A5C0B0D5_9BURK|nr:hypothetical protein [Pigmentiphaga aceris]QEI06087.1 hypothetical protein FXN63_09755 [Pigmentiphaga aceris]
MQHSSSDKSSKPATHAGKPPARDTAQATSAEVPMGAKILPPDSPVDVPRMPAPVAKPADVPDLSDPRGNTTSWADSPDADPHKKTARTSINNG